MLLQFQRTFSARHHCIKFQLKKYSELWKIKVSSIKKYSIHSVDYVKTGDLFKNNLF